MWLVLFLIHSPSEPRSFTRQADGSVRISVASSTPWCDVASVLSPSAVPFAHTAIHRRSDWERCLLQVWQDTNLARFLNHSATVPISELFRTYNASVLNFSRFVTESAFPSLNELMDQYPIAVYPGYFLACYLHF